MTDTTLELNFAAPELVAKFGSWMRVQVAFYDFLFAYGFKACPACFNQMATTEIIEGFGDGGNVYETAIARIESNLPNPAEAWRLFVLSLTEPSKLTLFVNGRVMAFDALGEQMPGYQGDRREVAAKLQGLDLSGCSFAFGFWGVGSAKISREKFFHLLDAEELEIRGFPQKIVITENGELIDITSFNG